MTVVLQVRGHLTGVGRSTPVEVIIHFIRVVIAGGTSATLISAREAMGGSITRCNFGGVAGISGVLGVQLNFIAQRDVGRVGTVDGVELFVDLVIGTQDLRRAFVAAASATAVIMEAVFLLLINLRTDVLILGRRRQIHGALLFTDANGRWRSGGGHHGHCDGGQQYK